MLKLKNMLTVLLCDNKLMNKKVASKILKKIKNIYYSANNNFFFA